MRRQIFVSGFSTGGAVGGLLTGILSGSLSYESIDEDNEEILKNKTGCDKVDAKLEEGNLLTEVKENKDKKNIESMNTMEAKLENFEGNRTVSPIQNTKQRSKKRLAHTVENSIKVQSPLMHAEIENDDNLDKEKRPKKRELKKKGRSDKDLTMKDIISKKKRPELYICCFTFGAPPCISKVSSLRKFVKSYILGDDLIAHYTPASVRRLERKIVELIPKGNSMVGNQLSYMKGFMSSFSQSSGSEIQLETEDNDNIDDDGIFNDETLRQPGRVYYVKPRINKGATIKEVFRSGTLREERIWRLHDIVVSKSMIDHHTIKKYVQTLANLPSFNS